MVGEAAKGLGEALAEVKLDEGEANAVDILLIEGIRTFYRSCTKRFATIPTYFFTATSLRASATMRAGSGSTN